MNFKRFISGVSAFAIAASAFAGMAVTVSALEQTKLYAPDLSSYTSSTQITAKVNTTGGPQDADTTGASISLATAQLCNVEDFGDGTDYVSAIPALDGWGYRHGAFSSLRKNSDNDQASGRQTAVTVSAEGIALNSIGNSIGSFTGVGAITFTPANNAAAQSGSGDVYYSFTAVVNTGTNDVANYTLGFNKGTGSTINPVGAVTLSTGTYDVAMYYNTETGVYSINAAKEGGDPVASSGENADIQGISIAGQDGKYGGFTIKNFEYGTMVAADATYKIVYKNADGTEIKDSVTKESKEGTSIALSDDDRPATIDYDGVTYYYDSNDAADQTVAADNSTVVTVKYRTAVPYTATVTAKDDDSTVLGTYSEDIIDKSLTAYVYYPVLIKNGDNWYKYDASGKSTGYYQATLTADSNTTEVTYNKVSDNIIYYGEFEDAADVEVNGDGTYPDRYSNGKCVKNGALTTGVLPAGKYDVYVGARNGSKNDAYKIYAKNGDVELGSVSLNGGVSMSQNPYKIEVILNEDAAITVSTENSNMQMDFVYVVQTEEFTTKSAAFTFVDSLNNLVNRILTVDVDGVQKSGTITIPTEFTGDVDLSLAVVINGIPKDAVKVSAWID